MSRKSHAFGLAPFLSPLPKVDSLDISNLVRAYNFSYLGAPRTFVLFYQHRRHLSCLCTLARRLSSL